MSTYDYSLQTLPLEAHKTIYSFLGPNAQYSRTCSALHEINKVTASLSGLRLAFTIEPTLLTTHGIPLVNATTPYPDQGLRIQKIAFTVVKKTWPLLSSEQRASFHGISRSRICVTPALFKQLLYILNTIDYRKALKLTPPLKPVQPQPWSQTHILLSQPQFSQSSQLEAISSTSWRNKKRGRPPLESRRTFEFHTALPPGPLFIIRRPQPFGELPPMTQNMRPPASHPGKK